MSVSRPAATSHSGATFTAGALDLDPAATVDLADATLAIPVADQAATTAADLPPRGPQAKART